MELEKRRGRRDEKRMVDMMHDVTKGEGSGREKKTTVEMMHGGGKK